MRAALDTNVLAYAEGVNGAHAKRAALDLVRDLPRESVFLPVQALGELFHVLVRKAGFPAEKARAALLGWQDAFTLIETSPTVMLTAVDLAVHHHLSIWDAVMLSAAYSAGCRLLLSEDFQTGFTWNGVTVVNPFLKDKHELLLALLRSEA